MSDTYNGQFNGNILLVGRTDCGKTTFLEKLAINHFLVTLLKLSGLVELKLTLLVKQKYNLVLVMRLKVPIATERDELDALIENFKLKALENNGDNVNLSNSFGEIRKMDRLIVLDDVSGVADLSKKFANFLTVSRKYG